MEIKHKEEYIMPNEEHDFPTLLKSFIIISLFAFILLSSIILFAGKYGKDTTEISDRIGLNLINQTLSSAQSTASNWQNTFEDIGGGNIFSNILDILGLLSVGMFNLVKSMATFIFLPFGIFSNILVNVLGIPLIVVSIINVLIILTIVFGIWSLVKRGI